MNTDAIANLRELANVLEREGPLIRSLVEACRGLVERNNELHDTFADADEPPTLGSISVEIEAISDILDTIDRAEEEP